MTKAADYKQITVAYRNGVSVQARGGGARPRQRGERQGRELVQRRARRRAGDPAPARRQHRGGGRRGARAAAGVPRPGAGRDRDAVPARPLAVDPRLRRRGAVPPGDLDHAGRAGDLPVPAQGVGDHHSLARGAGVADRHLRGDVRVRLLDQQHDAAGARAVGRLRGRRRDRHAGEHRAPHRRRHAAVRGGAQGLARGRLHHHLDHLLADRGVHPGAADGRHGRPRVPRIRGDDFGRDRRVGIRLADADADAVRARAQGPSRGREADVHSALVRGDVPQLAARLRMVARLGDQIQGDHAGGHLRDAGRLGLALHGDPEGLLPARGHRLHLRHHRGAERHRLPGDDRAAAQGRRHHPQGPGGRISQLDGRHRRPQPDVELRPHAARPQADERAQGELHRHDPAAAPHRQHGAGRRGLFPEHPEHPRGGAHLQERVPVHAAIQRHRGALPDHAGAAGRGREDRRAARRHHRPLHQESGNGRRGRPREGGGLRHHRRSDPPGALQRVRLAPDRHHLHAVERLPDHHAEHAGVPDRSVGALQDLPQDPRRQSGDGARSAAAPAAPAC